MNITEILPGIHYVGVNDRTTTRFEGLWSLPQGVSYNAYLAVGEKIALIDTVEESFGSRLIENIREAIGDRPIDYLVVNHMEPDHSSSIRALRLLYELSRDEEHSMSMHVLSKLLCIQRQQLSLLVTDMEYIGFIRRLVPETHWEPVFFDNANRIYGLGL